VSQSQSEQYIFTMYRLRRVHPPDRAVIDGVSLSFLPGAKIGVLGANGAGKSTLLRIMAGLDRDFSGHAELAPGATVGLLPQEPDLDPSTDVRGNVEQGVADQVALLRRFEEIGARLGEAGPDEMEVLLGEYQEVQDEIERRDAWDLDRKLDVAMDALRVPPGDQAVTTLSGGERRRVALCRLLLSTPDLLLLDEPTNGLDPGGRDAMLQLIRRIGTEFGISIVVCSHLLGEVERICDTLVAIDAGRLLRADRISSMTGGTGMLMIEVDEGVEELAGALAGLSPRRDGAALLVPLTGDETYDTVLRAVAELDLPLHRLDQRHHRVAELFSEARQ
jgi:ATPase subunit of ABC transporter with duplicated ATPase domains